MRERLGLAAGGGGQEMRNLVESIRSRLGNPLLNPLEDGAIIAVELAPGERLVFTTDSYVVHPYRFPGGDAGSLAVCGTVNDLAVMGARPRWLSLGLIVEEGLPVAELEAVLDSIAARANEAGVLVATGDTKVVERGKGDGLFINTAGIGILPAGRELGAARIQPGQQLIVNGTLGDHAIAVMLSREGMQFESDIQSDCAPLNGLVEAMFDAAGPGGIAVLRDLTRGGLAAVLNEFAGTAQTDFLVDEPSLPVRNAVRAASRVLGFEIAVLANEGKLLAVVEAERTAVVLQAMREHPYGRDAVVIGEVGPRFDPARPDPARPRRPLVLFRTASGGLRVVDMPLGELLPRIC
jgi:hydrogenase expression/formation protein HypE